MLNGRTNSSALLTEIRNGAYTHGKLHHIHRSKAIYYDRLISSVLLSPEIALSEKFKKKVLQDQAFQQHLVLVAIDEVHVVSEWGQHWRGSYSQLALLRDLIDRPVPWLGCSATLDPVMLSEVRELCGFNPLVRVQRTSINRPDIALEIRFTQHAVDSFRDLDFLIEPVKAAVERSAEEYCNNLARQALKGGDLAKARAIISAHTAQEIKQAGSESRACCRMIPKSVVYIDSITLVEKAAQVLIKRLVQTGCSKTSALDAIQTYHSELAEFDKRSVSAEFAKPDAESVRESPRHRIILATDAMGMGIDNPDIRIIVQWKQPPSMCALWQRAGRAARSQAICGQFVWMIERWYCGDRLDPSVQVKKRATERERRSVLPRGLWELINRPTCIREIILQFFGDDSALSLPPEADLRLCCSRCAGTERGSQAVNAGRAVRVIQSQKHITTAVNSALVQWRKSKAIAAFSSTVFSDSKEQLILSDKAVFHISRAGATVDSIDTLAIAANGRWADLRLYGGEVIEVIRNACLQATLAKTRNRRPLTAVDGNSERIRDGPDPKRMRLTGKARP